MAGEGHDGERQGLTMAGRDLAGRGPILVLGGTGNLGQAVVGRLSR